MRKNVLKIFSESEIVNSEPKVQFWKKNAIIQFEHNIFDSMHSHEFINFILCF